MVEFRARGRESSPAASMSLSSEWAFVSALPPWRRAKEDRWLVYSGIMAIGSVGAWYSSWVLLGIAFLLLWLETTRLLAHAGSSVRGLMDLPAGVDQFPVRLRYIANDVSYGADQGLLSFLDGSVHFQGRRTTFSFPVAGARIFRDRGKRAAPRMYSLRWDAEDFSREIQVRPFDSIVGLGSGYSCRFWLACPESEGRVTPEEPGLLPPRAPQPGKLVGSWFELLIWKPAYLALVILITLETGISHWPLDAVLLFEFWIFVRSEIRSLREVRTLRDLSGSWRATR